MKQQKNIVLLFSIIAFIVISCEKDDDIGEPVDESPAPYFLSLRTLGDNGTSDYVLAVQDISNEAAVISATGQGIEQLGWCYYASVGNTAFSFSYSTSNQGVAYTVNENGTIDERGSFAFERLDCFGEGDENTLVGVGAPWGGGSYDCEILLIDAESVGVTARKLTRLYASTPQDTLNMWPSSIITNDDKIYISFYPLVGATWETPITDTAYVAVYSFPGLDSLGILKDTRTGPIGYYGAPVSMVKADNGDIYTISPVSIAAGYTTAQKNSGILRIRNGAMNFDPSYHFDVEAASGGGKLLSAAWAGDNKLVGRMVIPGRDTAVWGAFNEASPIMKLVVIDVVNQTVTDVQGAPEHSGQYAAKALVEDGRVFMSLTSSTAGESRIYQIDPQTATATKGAKIEGLEVPAIFRW